MENARVALRPLGRSDLGSLALWLNAAHVEGWWRDLRTDITSLEAKYGPRIGGAHPIEAFVIEWGDTPVGFIQLCPAAEYARWPSVLGLEDTVAVDGMVGDSAALRHGVATAALRQLVTHISATRPERGISAATRSGNTAARATAERCGFQLVYEGPLPEDGLPSHAVYVRWHALG
jgi:aminoglycoside 6'-N-acetyltransferase